MDARLSRDMDIEDFVTVILAEFAPGYVRIVNCGTTPRSSWRPMPGDCSS
jgi:hypothetical protein